MGAYTPSHPATDSARLQAAPNPDRPYGGVSGHEANPHPVGSPNAQGRQGKAVKCLVCRGFAAVSAYSP